MDFFLVNEFHYFDSYEWFQMVFSSGKSVSAFIIALMVERGLLSYDDKVAKHWPDFAQKGKQDITIADVLRQVQVEMSGELRKYYRKRHIHMLMNILETMKMN